MIFQIEYGSAKHGDENNLYIYGYFELETAMDTNQLVQLFPKNTFNLIYPIKKNPFQAWIAYEKPKRKLLSPWVLKTV
jgi:hypothetical protein